MPNAPQRSSWTTVEQAERRAIGLNEHDTDVAGLAISGGGIRSATFALGILESLRDYQLLSKFHYLSTVSGGGYIGSWLSANCRRRVSWFDADWTESIRYLRRYSNYLSPRVGFFSADTWSMLTIWLRNALLIQATVILAIACALLVPRPLFWLFHHWPDAGHLRWATVLLFILGIVGIAGNHWQLTAGPPFKRGNPPGNRAWRPADLLRAKAWKIGLGVATVLWLAAFGLTTAVAFDPFAVLQVGDPSDTIGNALTRSAQAFLIAGFIVLGGFFLQPVVVRIVAWFSSERPQQVNYTQGYVQLWVVLPLMVVALLVTSVLWAQATGAPGVTSLASLTTYSALVTQAWKFWPFHLSIVFISFWLLSFFAIASRREPRRILIALAAPFAAVPALHAMLAAIVLIFQWFHTYIGGEWMAFVWGPPLVAMAFVHSIVVLIGMLGRDSTEGVREWWSRLGAWLAIYATAWMVIAVSAVYGPLWLSWAFKYASGMTISGIAGWAATVAGGLFAGNSGSTGGRVEGATAKAKEVLARIAPFAFIGGLLIGVSFVIHKIVLLNGGAEWWEETAGPMAMISIGLLLACLAVTILLAARVDINEFSLNAFYRNRLVRCYLGATRDPKDRTPQNFTGFDDADDMPIAVQGDDVRHAPFHIVNCALNLGGSSDLALHTRQSASFTLSPLHCGSAYRSRDQKDEGEEIGFISSAEFGHRVGGPTLGQAMSVSGAAASPNMGYHTSSVVAFLLTLFNVRLGWWFPNPSKATSGWMSPHFSLTYLAAELFGGASDKTSFVMVSDGGHFENLAAYELVRRRCKVIVISDGECDVNYEFSGLGTLIRVCEVDFNCRIDIVVDKLRPGGTAKWSEARFAIGTITYDGGDTGLLVYLKASMTGREDTSVLQYKSSHPEFPHESTGDQFYGEDQFESYRHLGRAIGAEAFKPLARTTLSLSAAIGAAYANPKPGGAAV
jgi:hypothetical protein